MTDTLIPEFDLANYDFDEWHQAEARYQLQQLSMPMRAMLRRHLDGRQHIAVVESSTINTLIARKLLCFGQNPHKRPRYTEATTQGRMVIAAMLANEAETLMAGGDNSTWDGF